jgi:hypothetical protein
MTNLRAGRSEVSRDRPAAREKRMKALSLAWVIALAALGCTGSLGDELGMGPPGGSSSGAGGGSSGSTSSGSAGGSSTGSSGTGGSGSSQCTPLAPVTRRLWRLSVEQYQNAVKDLLGLPMAPLLTNRGGEAQWAFFSDASLGVDDSFEYALYQAAESALPMIPVSVTACNNGEMPVACATRIAKTLGAKAFRRPLTADEIAALVTNPAVPAMGATPAVHAAPFLAAGTDTQGGIKLMIEAILLSSSFVYRTELGPADLAPDSSGNYPPTTLTPYEVATQLGFTFLGSSPDDALEAAAADPSPNGLGSTTGIAAQIDRLLALPAVRQNLTSIVAGWFNVGQVFLKTHDSTLLAALPMADQTDQTGIQNDLYASAQQFIADILWTKSSKLSELLTSQEVFFNSRLDALYPGVTYAGARPTSPTTFVAGTWPAAQTRIGLLGSPSYFWAQSDPAANSIVKRGKAIHDDIICADPLPPPIDLSTPMARAVIAMGDSEITKSDARISTAPCNGCHAQMDPYSRVLQNYGPIGNYRTLDEAGRPIDPTVTFSGVSPLAPQTISGPQAFAQALIASDHVNGCAVQKMASYLIGTMVQYYDTCEIDTIRTKFDQSDGTLGSLFREVVLADFGRARAGGTK